MDRRKTLLCFCLLLLLSLLVSYIVIVKAQKVSPSKEQESLVRPAAVAGSFYPREPEILRSKISVFLDQAFLLKKAGRLKILIVPHAGLDYSGPVAASGFKQLEGQDYQRVILLGASHRAFFEGVAIFDNGAWETPLGKVTINETLAKKLVSPDKELIASTLPHQEEHSLEVQLPFLQTVLPKSQIVPILLGQVSEETLNHLAQKIAANLDEQTLLLVSSDFSHYPSYDIANKVDRQTIQAILLGKAENLIKTIDEIESQHYPGLDTCACGYQAIMVALQVAEKLKISDFEKIKYANSGDLPTGKAGITGEKNQVVGYAAIGGWQQNNLSLLDESAQKEVLTIARETLKEHLSGRPLPPLSSPSPQLTQPLGAFVTLYKNDQLRGCIGKFEPKEPLWQVIQKMAIAAATEDPRFPKVVADELGKIKIEISVMSPRKKIDDWQKIRLGIDGVVIQYHNRGGTFLPQVAAETGWSLEEFLSQLCSQKAGLPPHCYKSPEVNLYTFEVQILEE